MIQCKTVAAVVSAALLLLAGCGGSESKQEEKTLLDLRVEVPEPGGSLIVGIAGDFDSLNELISNDANALLVIESMLFMTLTKYDRALNVGPHLAERWEFSPDRKTITYTLRPDVYWHDGVRTTSRDVVFTLNAMKDPRTRYANVDYMANVEAVEALDERTVRVRFKRAYATQLEDCQRPILPAHLLEGQPLEKMDEAEFGSAPVGNGPFKLVRWERGRRVDLVANDSYCFGRPYLDRITFRVMPSSEERMAALVNGDIDLVEAIPPGDIDRLRRDPEIDIYEYPQRGFQFVAWNTRNTLFADTRVRRALTYAINRKAIVRDLLMNRGRVLANPLMSESWSYNRNILPYPYDPVRAQSLLHEAGWKDRDGDGVLEKGDERFAFVIKTNEGTALRGEVARRIAEDLSRVGIDARVEIREWVTFVGDITKKTFDAVLVGWQDDFAWHPADQFHSSNLEGEFQLSGYGNPQADELMERAKEAVDKAEVARLHGRLQEILHRDQPYTVLYERAQYNGLHRRFQGVIMDSRSHFVNIAKWWVPSEARRHNEGVATR